MKQFSRQFIVGQFPNVTGELDGKTSLDIHGNRSIGRTNRREGKSRKNIISWQVNLERLSSWYGKFDYCDNILI